MASAQSTIMSALCVWLLLVVVMLHVAGCHGANPTTTMCAVGDGQGPLESCSGFCYWIDEEHPDIGDHKDAKGASFYKFKWFEPFGCSSKPPVVGAAVAVSVKASSKTQGPICDTQPGCGFQQLAFVFKEKVFANDPHSFPAWICCCTGDGCNRRHHNKNFWLPSNEPITVKCGKVACSGPDAVCVQIWGAANADLQEPKCLAKISDATVKKQAGKVCSYTEKSHGWQSQSLRTWCTAPASVPLTLDGKDTNVSLCCCREADCKDMSPPKPLPVTTQAPTTTTTSTGSSTMDGSQAKPSPGPPITDQKQTACEGGLNVWMVVAISLMVLTMGLVALVFYLVAINRLQRQTIAKLKEAPPVPVVVVPPPEADKKEPVKPSAEQPKKRKDVRKIKKLVHEKEELQDTVELCQEQVHKLRKKLAKANLTPQQTSDTKEHIDLMEMISESMKKELAVYAEGCKMLIVCNEPDLEAYDAPTRSEKLDQALESLKRRVSANLKRGIFVRDQLCAQDNWLKEGGDKTQSQRTQLDTNTKSEKMKTQNTTDSTSRSEKDPLATD